MTTETLVDRPLISSVRFAQLRKELEQIRRTIRPTDGRRKLKTVWFDEIDMLGAMTGRVVEVVYYELTPFIFRTLDKFTHEEWSGRMLWNI